MNKTIKNTVKEITEQTYFVTLKDSKHIDITQYPELNELGIWIDSKENIFILRTTTSRADVAEKITQVTGVPVEQIKVTYSVPI